MTGKLCSHALAFIAKLTREVQMNDFVHEYFSVERLRKAYACTFIPMTSKDLWPRVDLGYKIHKPKLRRKPRRPKSLGSRHMMRLAVVRKEDYVLSGMNQGI